MTNPIKSRPNIKFLFLLLLIVAGTYFFIHYDLYVFFLHRKRATALIRSYHPYDGLVFIFLQILQVVFAPLPGEVSGVIGGYLYGPVMGTFYSTIGLTIGSWLAFVIARIFGLPLVEKAVKPEVLQKYDYLMEHRGTLLSFILFLIPGFPKDCLCYIMGLSHMKTWTFLVISTIGRLFGTVLLSLSGNYAQNGQYRTLLVIIIASSIFLLLGYLYRDKLLEMLKKDK